MRVDPDVLMADAERLAAAAEGVDAVARRLARVCASASLASGATELAAALDDAGGGLARAVGHGGALVLALGVATADATHDYRRVEEALTRRWAGGDGGVPRGASAPAVGAR